MIDWIGGSILEFMLFLRSPTTYFPEMFVVTLWIGICLRRWWHALIGAIAVSLIFESAAWRIAVVHTGDGEWGPGLVPRATAVLIVLSIALAVRWIGRRR